jgi:hypothetical protein
VPVLPDRVFRGYRAGDVLTEQGQTRLKSSVFRSTHGVSVYDGARCSSEVALQSLQRAGPAWGLLTVTKAQLAEHGVALVPEVDGTDADDPARDAHCVLTLPNKSASARLAACAVVHAHALNAPFLPGEIPAQ